MPRMTPLHWKVLEKYILALGFAFRSQKGSHRIYRKIGSARPIVIPVHGDGIVDVGIIMEILKTAGADRNAFLLAIQNGSN